MKSLNYRVKLFKKCERKNEYGELENDYSLVLLKSCFASFTQGDIKQIKESKGQSEYLTSTFLIRYFENGLRADFIEFKGQLYEVLSILNLDEKSRYLSIEARIKQGLKSLTYST